MHDILESTFARIFLFSLELALRWETYIHINLHRSRWVGACNRYSCHGVFVDRFTFRSNFPRMRLPWECHDQSQVINGHHCVTRLELPFFPKRKRILKIDQSVKIPWHRLSMGVACSCSSAPDLHQFPRFAYICLRVTITLFWLVILNRACGAGKPAF